MASDRHIGVFTVAEALDHIFLARQVVEQPTLDLGGVGFD